MSNEQKETEKIGEMLDKIRLVSLDQRLQNIQISLTVIIILLSSIIVILTIKK